MNPFQWLFLILLLLVPVSGEAVEYRLQVVSLYEESFAYYLEYLEPGDGSEAPLGRLESSLDQQRIDKGTVLIDRWVQPAEPSLARAFGAVPVKAELTAGRDPFLPELRWQGEPGTRTLWVVRPQSLHFHELGHVGLKGSGPLRHVVPVGAAIRVERGRAVGFPANVIDFADGSPELWTRWLSPYMDLSEGIAMVVGVQPTSIHPDRVYLVVEQPAEPRTFKALLGWRKRLGVQENLYELPGAGGPNAQ